MGGKIIDVRADRARALARLRWAARSPRWRCLALGAGSAQARPAAPRPAAAATAPAGSEHSPSAPDALGRRHLVRPRPLRQRTPPAARPCGRTRSASPTAACPAAPRSSSSTTATSLVTQVIDRGPYIKGHAWDLTTAPAKRSASKASAQVRYAVAVEYARAER